MRIVYRYMFILLYRQRISFKTVAFTASFFDNRGD